MLDLLRQLWPHLTAAVVLMVDLLAAGHAVLYKRDPRSAVSWIGIIVVFPFIGAFLYWTLGINRIQRRACVLRPAAPHAAAPGAPGSEEDLLAHVLPQAPHLAALGGVVRGITGRPLLADNALRALRNGDEAYPAMLAAIEQAATSVSLSTYIFDHDPAGVQFVAALARAAKRGVAVRVLIDDVGARYSFPTVAGALHRRGVPTALFLPTFFHWRMPYINLRSHRKILVVDGQVGFTGGINIRQDNVLAAKPRDPVQDVHFEVRGPVVAHLQHTFAADWAFATGERLDGPTWFPALAPAGPAAARGVADGPDEDYDILRRVILGALACARRRVRIATPYFLPDLPLISALNVAAMRGVAVEILIPARNNLRTVGWACQAMLWQVLERGVRVWKTRPPFDHSKIMVVDDAWSMVGSGNWDARSLRLNFEFNLECYDAGLACELNRMMDEKQAGGREVTLADVDGRSLPVRLRDGVARLFTPYL